MDRQSVRIGTETEGKRSAPSAPPVSSTVDLASVLLSGAEDKLRGSALARLLSLPSLQSASFTKEIRRHNE